MSAPATVSIPAGTYQVDPVHSTVGFAVRHASVATFRSRFKEFAVALTVAEDGAASLTGSVQVASIDLDDPNFKGHLMADDFFAAEQNPEITFSAESVALDGEKLTVTGPLTMKGTTKTVTGTGTVVEPVEDLYGNTRIGLALETKLDRTDFGVSWNAELPKGGPAVANEVTLTLDLALVKA